MLVLSRKKDELIDIPGVGTLMVVEIRGDKVRLGFDFEPHVKVYRREVYKKLIEQSFAECEERGRDEETANVSH
ncbi:MAG: carbon storage regulator [Planctomycetaceae bacterium]|nr:carbon storage regulator [Planctomycetaceae bacterium]